MELNKKRSGKSWYDQWHDTDHHHYVHWALFLVIVIGAWALLHRNINDWLYNWTDDSTVTVHLAKPTARLSLDPQSQSIAAGETFAVNIVLDTGTGTADGVDIYSLHYDPTLLQVVDDVPNKSGVQIMPGTIMGLNAANIVEQKTGTIKFSQVSEGGTNFTGRGVLATIHFKALSTGSAYLQFDFSKGSTVDSNVAFKGKDQLTSVIDGVYVITAKK
jgi:hypothetical protein